MKLNLTIRTKLLAGFALLLAMSGIFALIANSQIKAMENLQRDTEGKITMIARADSAMWELRSGFPFYMAARDPKAKHGVKDSSPGNLKIITDNIHACGHWPGRVPEA